LIRRVERFLSEVLNGKNRSHSFEERFSALSEDSIC